MSGRVKALAVDLGQSGTRAVAIDGAGDVVGEGRAHGVIHLATPNGVDRATEATATACLEALESQWCRAGRVPALAVGTSGWAADGRINERLLIKVAARVPADRVDLTSDAITAFVGASDGRPGVVVAAGTGSVALAADGSGGWAKADGLGHLLGDVGSGFWIGREGLAAVLARQRRGRTGPLERRAIDRYGSLDRLLDEVHVSTDGVALIAGFAIDVLTLAAEGDPIARPIGLRAGVALGQTAARAANEVFARRVPMQVTLTGGLADGASVLLPALAARFAARPGSTVRAFVGGPLAGAVRLARRPELASWFPTGVLTRIAS